MSKSRQSKLKYEFRHSDMSWKDLSIVLGKKKNKTLGTEYKGSSLKMESWAYQLSLGERHFHSDRNKRIRRAGKKRMRLRTKKFE